MKEVNTSYNDTLFVVAWMHIYTYVYLYIWLFSALFRFILTSQIFGIKCFQTCAKDINIDGWCK